MQPEVLNRPSEEKRWKLSIPKDRRLTIDQINNAGEALYQDFLGPRTSREAFMMFEDSHDLAYRLIYLAGKEKYQRRIAAAISAATEALDGVVRKDELPHLRHVLRVGLRTAYRLLDNHGALTEKDIEKIEAMINHDTREDARKERGMDDKNVKEIWLKHSNREGDNRTFSLSKWPKDFKKNRRDKRIYNLITIFDQNDEQGNKKPNYEQNLKDAGLGPEKTSDDTLDSLLGDMAWASRLLRIQEIPENELSDERKAKLNAERKDIYHLLAGSADGAKKGSVYKTKQRRDFFSTQLNNYDFNQIAIYLATANRFVQDLEGRLQKFTPGFVPSPRREPAPISA